MQPSDRPANSASNDLPPPARHPIRLAVRAVPNAPTDTIVGWMGDSLKIKVHAPALDGRANDAVCATLAEALSLHRRSVRLIQGNTSRQKLVEIDGLSPEEMRRRLPARTP